jgi:hypothetical protein
VVSIRARCVRRLPLARLGAPAMVVAAALSVGTATGPLPSAARTLADAHPLTGPAIMLPFAATPRTYPFSHTTIRVVSSQPPAPVTAPTGPLPTTLDTTASTIPRRVLEAYVNAATLTDQADPQCRLSWQTLAGIGFVESDNAAAGGSANPNWDGVANPPIYGPMLNGRHRAVGPMQIMGSTWAVFAADGNHDGVRNPQDIDDAALAAGNYLCTVRQHLNRPTHLIRAIYGYNHSYRYVKQVLCAVAGYLGINPATLGINGLPKPRRHARSSGILVSTPTLLPMPSPTPVQSSLPLPLPLPTPTRSWAPSPSPTPHLPGR